MEKLQHLKLPVFQENVERKKNGGGGFSLPAGRNKTQFANQACQQAKKLSESFVASKKQLSDRIDPTLIFEIEINHKVYSLQLPELFFSEAGRKKISVVLTFTPETRATRGDSYLGNRMEFHLFHSQNPQILIEKYGKLGSDILQEGIPDDLKKFEIDLFPGANTRKAGCHQKAWKVYQREPKNRPKPPISLVLLNINKWMNDTSRKQDYCISVIFEHEKATELYNAVRANLRTRTKVR